MTKRHFLLLLGLSLTVWLSFFTDDDAPPTASLVEPTRPAAAPTTAARATPTAANDTGLLTLQERGAPATSLANELAVERPLFAATTWDIPPKPVPPPPPMAPPLPYAFIGKMLKDGAWEVFLSRGEATRVVRLHELVDSQYRVESIQPPTMTLMYLPLGQTQTLNIGKPE